jgi:hypothetical protein
LFSVSAAISGKRALLPHFSGKGEFLAAFSGKSAFLPHFLKKSSAFLGKAFSIAKGARQVARPRLVSFGVAMVAGSEAPCDLAALTESVAALQAAVGTTASTLTTTLTSNLTLMRNMNTFMDQYVQRSVHVTTLVSSQLQIRVRVGNRGAIPIVQCNVRLRVASADGNVATPVTLREETFHAYDDGTCGVGDVALEPNQSRTWNVTLDAMPTLQRYNAALSVTFPSPGSGPVFFLRSTDFDTAYRGGITRSACIRYWDFTPMQVTLRDGC